MRHVFRTALIACLVIVLIPAIAAAEVPDTMTYTGDLHKDGQPYDGMVSATFTLYDAETGGDRVWSETVPSLQVQDGQFVAELGSTNPFGKTFDGKDLWLEVTVNGAALTPRNHIGSLPYAKRAEVAESADDADSVGGKTVDEIEMAAASNVKAKDVSYDNANSGLSATNAQAALDEVAKLRAEIQSLKKKLGNKADKSYVDNNFTKSSKLSMTYATRSTLTSLESRVGANESDITSLQSNKADASALMSFYTKSTADSTFATLSKTYSKSQVDQQFTSRVKPLEEKTQDIDRKTVNGQPSVLFSGVNVHIRNGRGKTDSTNGKGNLIVGYNEDTGRDFDFSSSDGIDQTNDSRGGSHNVVVGIEHSYEQFGGLVVGKDNYLAGEWSSVSGGTGGIASGPATSVSGGSRNTASDFAASVTGGLGNTASGARSSVSGGRDNTATGGTSSVCGGFDNTASGPRSSVAGGYDNTAAGSNSSVSGGLSVNFSGGNHWGGSQGEFVKK